MLSPELVSFVGSAIPTVGETGEESGAGEVLRERGAGERIRVKILRGGVGSFFEGFGVGV